MRQQPWQRRRLALRDESKKLGRTDEGLQANSDSPRSQQSKSVCCPNAPALEPSYA